jgi:hypothetical protein
MSAEVGRTPEEIMGEIGQTRSEIAETLAALEVKLSPSGIMNELSSSLTPVRQASGDFARSLGVAIRDNPLPTALIGLGVCWLAVAGRRSGRLQPVAVEPVDEDVSEEGLRLDPWRLGQKGVVDEMGEMDERSETSDEIHEMGGRISETARRAARETRERTARLAAIAREKSGQAYHRTSEAGTRVASMARHAAADSGEFVRMHPIGVALGVLGVGAIVAAVMIARSERRRPDVARAREYLRDTADRTIDAARHGADRVKRAARDAADRYKRAGGESDEHAGGAIGADEQMRSAAYGLHEAERASLADGPAASERREQPS